MLPPLPTEQLAMDAITAAEFERAIVVSPGRGQVGWHLANLCPTGRVTNWFMDCHRSTVAAQAAREIGAEVDVVVSPDLPHAPVQLAVMANLPAGEAELTRELMQQMHDRLEIGGTMMVSVNAPRDTWVAEQMGMIFEKVFVSKGEIGCVYRSVKQRPLKRLRSFDSEVLFRDQDRLFRLWTRPGVFSHRSLDVAARHLIQHAIVNRGDRLLDMGCGSGAVGIALGHRTGGQVVAIDSNTRAIECSVENARRNGIESFNALLNHDGRIDQQERCDVALLNPPYYGDFRIAEHFMLVAQQQLRPGGRALVVTKSLAKYQDHTWKSFQRIGDQPVKGYHLIHYENTE